MKRMFLLAAVLLIMFGVALGFERMPVAEIISATWCGPCGALHSYIDENYPALYDDAVLIDYITDSLGSDEVDPYCYYIYCLYNPDEDAYYIPSGGIDGVWGFVGGDKGPEIIDSLNARIGLETPVGLWFEDVTSETAYVAVTIDDVSAAGSYRLFVLVLENGIILPGTAIDEYNWTVRDMLTGTTGEPFTISYGETLSFAIPYEIGSDWIITNCELAAFVDDDSTNHTIYQGCHGTIPPPDYYFLLHTDETSSLADPGDEVVFYIGVENNGINGDTIDIHLETEAPSGWTINACTPDICFLDDAYMYVASGDVDTVSVHFYTDDSEVGSGSATLTFTSRATSREYEVDFSVSTGGGILVVDDDQDQDYEDYITGALDELGENYSVFDRNTAVPTASSMGNFDAVIWLTGWHWDDVLTTEDVSVLSTYLDDGGKLFIHGTDIGWDLVANAVSPSFMTDYLKSDWETSDDSASSHNVYGVSGDPITDGFSFSIERTGTSSRYADILHPRDGAEPILYYGTGTSECAGLRYAGTYRLIYFGFGFESIEDDRDQVDLLGNVLDWLLESGISDAKKLPEHFSLSVSPNPFNAVCRIDYKIPEQGELSILDISGRNLISQKVEGTGKFLWNAGDEPSGIYFARLRWNGGLQERKIILLK